MNDIIATKLKLLPDAPGVYRMLDADGKIIYIGKAVNLKNRVRSYFRTDKNRSPKVAAMISHISDFEYILVKNETEALTLEAAMTKELQPRYNILLKDDKHFPYLRLDTRQDFPRFELVRRAKNDGARYFGPYLSSVALKEVLNCISEDFPVRHCKKDIKKAIAKNERPCLMYHLGKCCAPCSGQVSREKYLSILDSVSSFLDGNTDAVTAMLTDQMKAFSSNMEFEKAARCRDRIRAIRQIHEKQQAMSAGTAERDVLALARDGDDAVLFAMFIRNGAMVGSRRFSMTCGDESSGEIMGAFLLQYYSDSGDIPCEICVSDMPENGQAICEWLKSLKGHSVSLIHPQRGEKRAQIDMARKNGIDIIEKERQLKYREWERTEGALSELCGAIGLDELPDRIECYDNSHIHGRDTVSGMIVFSGGNPLPGEYRRFRIKEDAGGDDILAMREVLRRRFERSKSDPGFAILPDLIVVDGGRTQLGAALDVLNEYGLSNIPAIGLAEKNEEIILPYSDAAIRLPMNSPALHLLERIRDEAHRFAITYHRSLRVRNMLFSELDSIEGIGPKRKKLLFDAFTTRDAIASADIDELSGIKGMTASAAKSVYDHFHGEKQ